MEPLMKLYELSTMTAGRLGSACSLRSRRSKEPRAGTVPEPSRAQSTCSAKCSQHKGAFQVSTFL